MIKLLVDSAADCGKDAYDYFVPLAVQISGKEYRDGVDLQPDDFYQLLAESTVFPKTSQPSPEDFVEVFQRVKKAGDSLIYICLSSALSGTYQSARIARQIVEYDEIYIVDSCAVTHLIGILADFAASRIRLGWEAARIAEACHELKGRLRVLAGVDTLEYLHKGGRLSKASATVGELTGIKPIVSLTQEGKVYACAKAIGVPRAIKLIQERLAKCELDPDFPVYTVYTSGTEHVEKLEAKLAAAGISVAGRKQVGPTIGAHVGPNVYGVLYVEK